MEASVDHMAREASSVRRYPSSLPSRAAWSCLTEGSGISGMVRSTLHAERTCRQSEIPAFFGETIQFPGQQGEAGLFGHAEVRFGVAEDAVSLGQGYAHGSFLTPSLVCPSHTSQPQSRTAGNRDRSGCRAQSPATAVGSLLR